MTQIPTAHRSVVNQTWLQFLVLRVGGGMLLAVDLTRPYFLCNVIGCLSVLFPLSLVSQEVEINNTQAHVRLPG